MLHGTWVIMLLLEVLRRWARTAMERAEAIVKTQRSSQTRRDGQEEQYSQSRHLTTLYGDPGFHVTCFWAGDEVARFWRHEHSPGC